jgi:recombinational DNA repair protein RecT
MTQQNQPQNALAQWQGGVAADVRTTVSAMLTGERAKQVHGRIMAALSSAALTSPEITACSRPSVVRAIAWCALTGIMPSPSNTKVYFLPKKIRGQWELQCWPNHRAYIQFAANAGYAVTATPVHVDDELSIEDDVIKHKGNPDRNPDANTLRGFIVRAWPFTNPESKVARWVNIDTLNARRAKSDSAKSDFSPWNNWELEMYEKTAIKYAAARGLFPLDDSTDYLGDEESAFATHAPQPTHQPRPESSFAQLAQAVGAKVVEVPQQDPVDAPQHGD